MLKLARVNKTNTQPFDADAAMLLDPSSRVLQVGMGEEKKDDTLIPSKEELEALLHLSKTGRLRKMRQQLESLIDQDCRYSSFAQPILRLEKQFKVDEIESLLSQYLSLPVIHS